MCLSLLFKLQELPTPQLCHAEYVYRVKHIHASHFAEKTVVVVHVQQWYTDPKGELCIRRCQCENPLRKPSGPRTTLGP